MKAAVHNNPLDQQYLKAMGIDLWVPKGHESVASVATPQVAVDTEFDVPQADTTAAGKPLASCTAADLAAIIPNLNVVVGQSNQSAELLVVTDNPAPAGENLKLLTSMFGAIKIDAAQWLQATLTDDASANSVQAVAAAIKPQAVVLMLRTGANINALSKLRGQQIQLASLSTFAVVTFHPQDLIDNAEIKRPAWEDLKLLRQRLG